MPRGGPLVGPGVAAEPPGPPPRDRAPSGGARETTAASPRAAVVLLSQPPPSVGVERFGGVVAGIDDPVTGGGLVARSSGSGGVVLVRSGCGAGCGGSRSVAPLGVAPGTGFRLRRSGCGCTTVVVVGFSGLLSAVAGRGRTVVGRSSSRGAPGVGRARPMPDPIRAAVTRVKPSRVRAPQREAVETGLGSTIRVGLGRACRAPWAPAGAPVANCSGIGIGCVSPIGSCGIISVWSSFVMIFLPGVLLL